MCAYILTYYCIKHNCILSSTQRWVRYRFPPCAAMNVTTHVCSTDHVRAWRGCGTSGPNGKTVGRRQMGGYPSPPPPIKNAHNNRLFKRPKVWANARADTRIITYTYVCATATQLRRRSRRHLRRHAVIVPVTERYLLACPSITTSC